jgi:NAD(P)H-dependent FMN reductase
VWAQAELRKVLTTIGAVVIDEELPVGRANDAFDESGRLKDQQLRDRLGEIITTLLQRTSQPPAAAMESTGIAGGPLTTRLSARAGGTVRRLAELRQLDAT